MLQSIVAGVVAGLVAGGVLLAVELWSQRRANKAKKQQYQRWHSLFRGVTADGDRESADDPEETDDPEEIASFLAYLDERQIWWDAAYVKAAEENGAAEVVHQHATRYLLDYQLRFLSEISYGNKVIAAGMIQLSDLLGNAVAEEERYSQEERESSGEQSAAGTNREDTV